MKVSLFSNDPKLCNRAAREIKPAAAEIAQFLLVGKFPDPAGMAGCDGVVLHMPEDGELDGPAFRFASEISSRKFCELLYTGTDTDRFDRLYDSYERAGLDRQKPPVQMTSCTEHSSIAHLEMLFSGWRELQELKKE